MTALSPFGRKLIGFFVDDPFLAMTILVTVLAAALCRLLLSARPLLAGALLAGGCLLGLAVSVARAAGGRNGAPG